MPWVGGPTRRRLQVLEEGRKVDPVAFVNGFQGEEGVFLLIGNGGWRRCGVFVGISSGFSFCDGWLRPLPSLGFQSISILAQSFRPPIPVVQGITLRSLTSFFFPSSFCRRASLFRSLLWKKLCNSDLESRNRGLGSDFLLDW